MGFVTYPPRFIVREASDNRITERMCKSMENIRKKSYLCSETGNGRGPVSRMDIRAATTSASAPHPRKTRPQ